MDIYWLDLVGVFAFAFLGSRFAIDRKLNALGMVACGFLAAVGGGTVRELILNHTPFYFYNHTYLAVILAGTIASKLPYQRVSRVEPGVLLLDAVGTVAFAFIGAAAAMQAHLGLFGSVFFALLTACGGGMLCDIACHTVPRAFRDGWYTLPPCVLGVAYWATGGAPHQLRVQAGMLLGALGLQLSILYSQRSVLSLKRTIKTWAAQLRTACRQFNKLLTFEKIDIAEIDD